MKKTLYAVKDRYLAVEDVLAINGLVLAGRVGFANQYQNAVNYIRDTRSDLATKTEKVVQKNLAKIKPSHIKNKIGNVKDKVVDTILTKTLGHNLNFDFQHDFGDEFY